mmetsp:Transcript_54768/g.130075  ORF Transcript_54768/g.130075 Transcript_54768/m.130075 type:complete len:204 (-) Transcript_54768:587-1198(-)
MGSIDTLSTHGFDAAADSGRRRHGVFPGVSARERRIESAAPKPSRRLEPLITPGMRGGECGECGAASSWGGSESWGGYAVGGRGNLVRGGEFDLLWEFSVFGRRISEAPLCGETLEGAFVARAVVGLREGRRACARGAATRVWDVLGVERAPVEERVGEPGALLVDDSSPASKHGSGGLALLRRIILSVVSRLSSGSARSRQI